MPKDIRDIIPSGRKSIRDIPIPIRRAEKDRRAEPEVPILPRIESEPAEEYVLTKRGGGRKAGWLGGLAGVIVLIFVGFALTSGATVSYVPKTTTLNFSNDSYTAHQTPSGGQLPFSVIKLSGDKSVDVPATGEETVSEKAKGTVVIYNEQASPQILVKTTRLETADGKIYRIQQDITIPAKGNIETLAVADQPGAAYNIPLSDLTIPGFKGTSRYELVYARSKTAMAGGFVGTRKKVSDADLAKAKTNLEESLRSDLLSQARAQMPSDFVLFPGLAEITYELLPVEGSGGTSAKVTERGNLNAAIFKKSELAQYLALQKLGANNLGSEVEMPDFSKLIVSVAGSSSAGLLRADTLRIQVSGSAEVIYITDEVALASDLVGTPKSSLDGVLKRYPSIESATVSIRPFWKSSFPNDVTEIKIEAR